MLPGDANGELDGRTLSRSLVDLRRLSGLDRGELGRQKPETNVEVKVQSNGQ